MRTMAWSDSSGVSVLGKNSITRGSELRAWKGSRSVSRQRRRVMRSVLRLCTIPKRLAEPAPRLFLPAVVAEKAAAMMAATAAGHLRGLGGFHGLGRMIVLLTVAATEHVESAGLLGGGLGEGAAAAGGA